MSYHISYELNEIKPIIYQHINRAHDDKNPYNLSSITNYDLYHQPLEKFFYNNKKIKPSMADRLAFVLLLSYPLYKINEFNTITDLKLFSNKNSDFKVVNFFYSETAECDCICSYQQLRNVTLVQNIYSGIRLVVGSECILKYGLISKEEEKILKELIKRKNESQKEIGENKPFGFYAEKRRLEKEAKQIEKENKQIEKENKQIEKKINSGKFKICYMCNTNIVDIRNNKLVICNKCSNTSYNNFVKKFNPYDINDCFNCDKKFISQSNLNIFLCNNCKKYNKIVKCKMCHDELFMININSNDIYCDMCEKQIFNCIDCNNNFIRTNLNKRCNDCHYIYENKLVTSNCYICEETFVKKEKEIWKKKCLLCFQNETNKINNKECIDCGNNFHFKQNENWRTFCSECFKKNNVKINCLECSEIFNRKVEEKWKTKCIKCYKK
jgi:hypothetical protein